MSAGTDESPPIVFVPGNSDGGDVWDPAVRELRQRGHTRRDMRQVDFGTRTPSHAEMADHLDDVVDELDADTIDVVAHSLGATGVRWWIATRGAHDQVRRCVLIAGANHGLTPATYAARMGLCFGMWSVAPFLRGDYHRLQDHPLQVLNRDETLGDVDYYTIRGARDHLFRLDPESPKLDGAENVVVDETHTGLIESEATHALLDGWLA